MSKAYEQSGVDIHAGYEAVERMSSHVKRTLRKEVIGGLGGFGATFDLSQLNMKAPVLVSGTDGVGTKLKLAIDNDKHDTIGIDAVAMCVNDILTTGAEPLYFLDYIATHKVVPEIIEQIVKGISDGCEETNTALIGGETAEMGEMYHEGEYDLAGFAVGAVEKEDYIDGSAVKPGQVIIGLASNGIHSNGYSLVRQLIKKSGINLNDSFGDSTYLETFLAPTQLYVKPILELKKHVSIKAMNHITGGGFYENIPRSLPEGLAADIDSHAFPTPAIFDWLQKEGNISTDEMYNIFNMGIGYTVIVNENDKEQALKVLKEQNIDAYEIGRIIKDDRKPIHIQGGINVIKVAIFASGSGSNFENIVRQVQNGNLSHIEISALYTDHNDAYCIDRAKALGIKVHINEPKDFESKSQYEKHLLTLLSEEGVQWIILAGYMRLIGQDILNAFPHKILNIHPSLLPKFKGIDAIGQAYRSGDIVTGSTVHYVDSGMDTGEIIEQRQCDIKTDDTKEDLEERVKQLEYELYPSVIAKIIQ